MNFVSVTGPTEREGRLFQMLSSWFVAIDVDRVDLEDLCRATERPGGIVRCDGNPTEVLQVHLVEQNEAIGCVAGWISEEA